MRCNTRPACASLFFALAPQEKKSQAVLCTVQSCLIFCTVSVSWRFLGVGWGGNILVRRIEDLWEPGHQMCLQSTRTSSLPGFSQYRRIFPAPKFNQNWCSPLPSHQSLDSVHSLTGRYKWHTSQCQAQLLRPTISWSHHILPGLEVSALADGLLGRSLLVTCNLQRVTSALSEGVYTHTTVCLATASPCS